MTAVGWIIGDLFLSVFFFFVYDDGESKFAFRDFLSVHGSDGFAFAHGGAHGDDVDPKVKLVARLNGFTEFHFVHGQKIGDEALESWVAQNDDSRGLSQGLHDKDARHDGLAGEVADEERLVHGHVLDGVNVGVAVGGHDSVN